MLGLLVYILASLLIYYVTIDWPWIVFCAGAYVALFVSGLVCVNGLHKRREWLTGEV